MILDTLTDSAKKRVAREKQERSFDEIAEAASALPLPKVKAFYRALKKEEMSFICEIKKASPSKGVICADFPYLSIARQYTDAGADAVSVLTEPEFFMGDEKYMYEISKSGINIPLLKKDFVVDLYQVYRARLYGASAVLLICAVLNKKLLGECIDAANKIGLSALVEAHDAREINTALEAGAKIIGINNRDLKTFTVDLSVSESLAKLIPDDIIFVSESGISSSDDIKRLKDCGADAVLIGEALMRADDKRGYLTKLKEKI
ncbi:MAG: indole-3-glycerol phosphate synthase TrpC [Clostridiales bacterium]|jgi:indole-3-glycerol phosphate synthase|nr:indole-3-glycerol phosphate synthase TrpC [Clostridiales bacterium]